MLQDYNDTHYKLHEEWEICLDRNSIQSFRDHLEEINRSTIVTFFDFSRIFEVACDASQVGTDGVLSQEGREIAYFSENLNDAKQEIYHIR